MKRGSIYEHLYALKDKETGGWILYYRASSQKHKALFATRKKAEKALSWFNESYYIEIVEL